MPELKPLIIGDLKINIPIIQGGMGVQVSTAPLVSAVSNAGAVGTIAGVGLGYGSKDNDTDFIGASNRGLIEQIRQTREKTKGVFGVNIMHALSNFQQLVTIAVKEKIQFIASGAGLPLELPKIVREVRDLFDIKKIPKMIPIVSSARGAGIFINKWLNNFQKAPDAIIVEGPLAGGHLGFKYEEMIGNSSQKLETIVQDVINKVRSFKLEIPVIAAGGIFDGYDIARFLQLGAQGVQIASRFVATFECSVADAFKKIYMQANSDDLRIIKSPVGMPGRAIVNRFVEAVERGEEIPYKCGWRCLKTCDPNTAPFCIAEAMFNASIGDTQNGLFFAGANVGRINKIVSVNDIIEELVEETKYFLSHPEKIN